jgi:hypothetical protein
MQNERYHNANLRYAKTNLYRDHLNANGDLE